MKTVITAEIAGYIKENFLKESVKDMCKKLGISNTAISIFMKKNNLRVPPEVIKSFTADKNRKKFTEAENKFIIDNIATMTNIELATALKMGRNTINKQAKVLGLQEIVNEKIKNNQYKKGNIPPNKGKKWDDFMPAEKQALLKVNLFKKGQLPHNTLPDWSETKRTFKDKTYTMIKVPGNRKLVYKHVWLWEHYHGKVPKGFNIIFKDKNTQNITLENLQCVSNKELMEMNSFQNLPQELKEILHIKSEIKRQIKRYGNTH